MPRRPDWHQQRREPRRPRLLPDFRVPASACPHCGAWADGALAVTGIEGPEPGDAMLCIACGTWSIYTDTMARRHPTADEALRIAVDDGAQHAYAVWAAAYRRPMP
jgi:hypothetical protein